MRVWFVVAVVAVVVLGGCKKEESAPAVGQQSQETKPVAAPPPSETKATGAPLRFVSPRKLWSAYSENEVAADMEYRGKIVEVAGLVEEIAKDATDSILVTLDTGELLGGVVCRFEDDEARAVAALSKRQLVSLTGKVRGLVLKSPILERCHVAWAGPKAKVAVDSQEAFLFARSTEICALELLARLGMEKKGKDGSPVTIEELRAAFEKNSESPFAKMMTTAKGDLADAGVAGLPCDKPGLPIALRCDGDVPLAKHPDPECRTPFVGAVLSVMQH